MGRTIALARAIDPDRLAKAIRRGTSDGNPRIELTARRAGSIHHRVGQIRPDRGLRVRSALAAAGRARGLSTPVDPEIRSLADRLDSFDADPSTPVDDRAAVARAGTVTDELREEVAELRGRLAARRAHDIPTEGIEADLANAVGELTDTETDAIAAEQALSRARSAARQERDRLAERLAVEDALANARRRARAALVERLRDPFGAAVRAVPRRTATDPFAADPVCAALAIARLAQLAAPVVLVTDCFQDAAAASAWLAAPVISLEYR